MYFTIIMSFSCKKSVICFLAVDISDRWVRRGDVEAIRGVESHWENAGVCQVQLMLQQQQQQQQQRVFP